MHGNVKHPELYERESLEELVRRYGTAARIAQAVGCRRQNVDKMLRRLGVKACGYAVSDEEEIRLRMG
ncbi:MAG TPA: hypothetical protein O0X42_00610 [Methanocorpusculum sp.]|nr:hypothetical protein [Methanocorpusculum sp.]